MFTDGKGFKGCLDQKFLFNFAYMRKFINEEAYIEIKDTRELKIAKLSSASAMGQSEFFNDLNLHKKEIMTIPERFIYKYNEKDNRVTVKDLHLLQEIMFRDNEDLKL